MIQSPARQQGFVLAVSLISLVVLTLIVINAIRGTTMNEKMAGNYMDRTRAMQAAEQALQQGEGVLRDNAESCLSGCNHATIAKVGDTAVTIPAAWSDAATGIQDAKKATDQKTSAQFVINQLPDVDYLPPGKSDCKAYSILSRGVGLDTRAVVVLQTVALLCPLS